MISAEFDTQQKRDIQAEDIKLLSRVIAFSKPHWRDALISVLFLILLSVVDIAGRTVKSLVEGERSAGEHSVVWDGYDAAGEPAPAGIYFYRLRSAGIDLTRKLIVIR